MAHSDGAPLLELNATSNSVNHDFDEVAAIARAPKGGRACKVVFLAVVGASLVFLALCVHKDQTRAGWSTSPSSSAVVAEAVGEWYTSTQTLYPSRRILRETQGPDWASVKCPHGLFVLGGGCKALSHPYYYTTSMPTGTDAEGVAQGWMCGGGGGTKQLWVYCGSEKPVVKLSSTGSHTLASCDAGQYLMGGGCSDIYYPNNYNGPLNTTTWRCSGHVDHTKTTFAICGRAKPVLKQKDAGENGGFLQCDDDAELLGGGCFAPNWRYLYQYNGPAKQGKTYGWKCEGHHGGKTLLALCATTTTTTTTLTTTSASVAESASTTISTTGTTTTTATCDYPYEHMNANFYNPQRRTHQMGGCADSRGRSYQRILLNTQHERSPYRSEWSCKDQCSRFSACLGYEFFWTCATPDCNFQNVKTLWGCGGGRKNCGILHCSLLFSKGTAPSTFPTVSETSYVPYGTLHLSENGEGDILKLDGNSHYDEKARQGTQCYVKPSLCH
eukprot:TRINITY_DN5870_c0_g1_i1.p1 TRINITY_DN5870_c0_g1~~TRINITY_DN5870_c0_g1_i1.p1  ORF type:complete len:499 (+),score=23.94 TRINITY_DN5870_c0_g1_i1:65-1561(+)